MLTTTHQSRHLICDIYVTATIRDQVKSAQDATMRRVNSNLVHKKESFIKTASRASKG